MSKQSITNLWPNIFGHLFALIILQSTISRLNLSKKYLISFKIWVASNIDGVSAHNHLIGTKLMNSLPHMSLSSKNWRNKWRNFKTKIEELSLHSSKLPTKVLQSNWKLTFVRKCSVSNNKYKDTKKSYNKKQHKILSP